MAKMHNDERIYQDMISPPVSVTELKKVRNLITKWAEISDNDSLRIVFLSCINIISAMGPAYCRIAAATLMDRAEKISPEKFDS